MSSLKGNRPKHVLTRIEAVALLLQAGADDSEEHERELLEIAQLVHNEHMIWHRLYESSTRVPACSPARLRSLLTLLVSSIHAPETAGRVPRTTVNLFHLSAYWLSQMLQTKPESPQFSSTQLALAQAVLRSKVLHGCWPS